MNKKLLGKILMFSLPAVLALIIVLIATQPKKEKNETIAPPEQPTPTQVLHFKPKSRWATDPTVLEIKNNLQSLSDQINNTDLKESNLLPPVLDTNVKF